MNNADTSNLHIEWDIADGACNHLFLPVKFSHALLPSHEGSELLEPTAEDRCAPAGQGAAYVKVPTLRRENLLYFSPSHSSQRADVFQYTGLLLTEGWGRACLLDLKYS